MSRVKAIARTVLPAPARARLRRPLDELRAVRELPERMARLETLSLESHERLHDRSQQRWRQSAPDVGLTFGRALTGDAFVAKARQYGVFGPGRTVLEVGPGYGRLLEAAVRTGAEFDRWIGVDLSENNVATLQGRFASDGRASFVAADAAEARVDEPIDSIVSSLTLKHVYPSFEPVLANLTSQMREGGVVVIDLIEGDRRYFQADRTTYIRWYSRDEARTIFERCGCEVVAFDEVEHDPDHRRLIVAGRRSG